MISWDVHRARWICRRCATSSAGAGWWSRARAGRSDPNCAARSPRWVRPSSWCWIMPNSRCGASPGSLPPPILGLAVVQHLGSVRDREDLRRAFRAVSVPSSSSTPRPSSMSTSSRRIRSRPPAPTRSARSRSPRPHGRAAWSAPCSSPPTRPSTRSRCWVPPSGSANWSGRRRTGCRARRPARAFSPCGSATCSARRVRSSRFSPSS